MFACICFDRRLSRTGVVLIFTGGKTSGSVCRLRTLEWKQDNSVFTVRRYASAVLAVIMCLSVRLSVRPPNAGIVSKRLNTESHKQHHTIAKALVFGC